MKEQMLLDLSHLPQLLDPSGAFRQRQALRHFLLGLERLELLLLLQRQLLLLLLLLLLPQLLQFHQQLHWSYIHMNFQ